MQFSAIRKSTLGRTVLSLIVLVGGSLPTTTEGASAQPADNYASWNGSISVQKTWDTEVRRDAFGGLRSRGTETWTLRLAPGQLKRRDAGGSVYTASVVDASYEEEMTEGCGGKSAVLHATGTPKTSTAEVMLLGASTIRRFEVLNGLEATLSLTGSTCLGAASGQGGIVDLAYDTLGGPHGHDTSPDPNNSYIVTGTNTVGTPPNVVTLMWDLRATQMPQPAATATPAAPTCSVASHSDATGTLPSIADLPADFFIGAPITDTASAAPVESVANDQSLDAESAPLAGANVTNPYTEVIIWAPVGMGESSFGHVSVNVNGTSYSFGPGGMDIRPIEDYLGRNSFRDGLGLVRDLNSMQQFIVETYLRNFSKYHDYIFLTSNCGDPIEESLELLGYDLGVNVRPNALRDSLLDAPGLVKTTVSHPGSRPANGPTAP